MTVNNCSDFGGGSSVGEGHEDSHGLLDSVVGGDMEPIVGSSHNLAGDAVDGPGLALDPVGVVLKAALDAVPDSLCVGIDFALVESSNHRYALINNIRRH